MYSVRGSGGSALNTRPRLARRPSAPSRPADRQRHRPHLLGLIANALFQEVGNQSRLHRGPDSDSGMLWLRGRDPGPRIHHTAIGLSAAVDPEDGAAHINPSGPSREGPSTSPQPSITAGLRAFSLTSHVTQ